MNNENDSNSDQGRTGSDLQQSQEGGSGGRQSGSDFTRDQQQSGQDSGGQQMGGGSEGTDMGAGGGSSGSGGYGNAQNQQNHQGQEQGLASYGSNPEQPRGEGFDEQQGGGRGADSVSDMQQGESADIERDQRAHQDRGQSELDDQE
jgi:hypothetical protein